MAMRKLRDEVADMRADVSALRSDTREIRAELGAFRRAAGFEPPLASDPPQVRRAYAWKRTAQVLIAYGAVDALAALWHAMQ